MARVCMAVQKLGVVFRHPILKFQCIAEFCKAKFWKILHRRKVALFCQYSASLNSATLNSAMLNSTSLNSAMLEKFCGTLIVRACGGHGWVLLEVTDWLGIGARWWIPNSC